MEKKYQVFISSTYIDLIEERAKVRDAILSMYHFPVGMELFGAANEEQWQIISETIDSSDYYVLIIGQRYGSVIPGDSPDAGISYTEKEFRYALEKHIPVLAFIINDNVPVKPEFIEKDHPEKLDAFKTLVKTGRLVEWWSNPDDLAQKVTNSLYKQITRSKRPGWIRGDSVDIEKSLKTITELTERNQQLVEENKALFFEIQKLKQKSERKPKLIISFSATEPDKDEKEDALYARKDNMYMNENDGTVHLKVGSVGTGFVEAKYEPISKSDFIAELRGYITDEEIQIYNQALPSKDEVSAYIDTYRAYHMIADHGIAITLTIQNIGTAKATDISATVEFPKEISVFDIYEVQKMDEPKALKKPRDLQEIAYERAHKSEVAIEKMFKQIGEIGAIKPYEWPRLPIASLENAIYESVKIHDNKVEIETKREMVHTKSDWFNGVYIVPAQKGEFKVKATLMCAEYEEPEKIEITFICE